MPRSFKVEIDYDAEGPFYLVEESEVRGLTAHDEQYDNLINKIRRGSRHLLEVNRRFAKPPIGATEDIGDMEIEIIDRQDPTRNQRFKVASLPQP